MSLVLNFFKKQKMLVILLAFFIILSFTTPNFLKLINIVNLFTQIAIYGVIACGLIFVMIGGEFDISVGSVMALSGVITVKILNGMNTSVDYLVVFLVLLAMSVVIGILNGLLVAKVKINSFIVTLGGMMFYRGLAFYLSDGNPIACTQKSFINISNYALLKFPITVWIFIILVILVEIVLIKSRYGRNVYATGGNYDVAQYSGIKVDFYKISTYIMSAAAAALAGFLLASRLNTGAPTHGEDAAMSVISAMVLGGVSLSGGEGGMVKAFIGLMILGLLTNALNMIGVYAYYHLAIKGLLLIIVVSFDRYYNRVKATD